MKLDFIDATETEEMSQRGEFIESGTKTGRFLGIDVGAETIKIVEVVSGGRGVSWTRRAIAEHQKTPRESLVKMLGEFDWDSLDGAAVTGRFARQLYLPVIPVKKAQGTGCRFLNGDHPVTIVSIGSHGFSVQDIHANGHDVYRSNSRCSQGTGNFLRQLCSRFGLSVEDASRLAADVAEPAALSGRCPVILKTDMTHLANKGESQAKILAGLFDAVCENVLQLVRTRGDGSQSVLLIGGVSRSARVRSKVEELLKRRGLTLNPNNDDDGLFFEALGAALHALQSPKHVPKIDDIFHPLPPMHLDRLPALADSLRLVERMTNPADEKQNGHGHDVILGLDIGSTGSKLVAIDASTSSVLWEGYRRTGGKPVEAAQDLVKQFIDQTLGRHRVLAIGSTGSGREIVGSLLATCYGGDAVFILNEIAAHATGALHFDKRVDTIFEIGGQDAKYIRLSQGRIVDCAMNEACSAGTGSFIEEQGCKFAGIGDVVQLSREAMAAPYGVSLGQHCSVFMAEIIEEAVSAGVEQRAIIAGLYDSIILNYLHRVKGNRSVGSVIFCQGMPFASDALAAAVARQTGSRVIVPPNPGTAGALGIALLAQRELNLQDRAPLDLQRFLGAAIERRDNFICKATTGCGGCGNKCRIDSIKTIVGGRRQNFTWGGGCSLYDKGTRKKKLPDLAPDPFRERTDLIKEILAACPDREGRPRVALTDEFALNGLFPFFATFIHECGFNLHPVTGADHSVLKRGIREAVLQFCAPMQLYQGVISHAMEAKPDFVLLPMLREASRIKDEPDCATCPIVQGSADILKHSLPAGNATRILSPVIDVGEGQRFDSEEFAAACRSLALELCVTENKSNAAFQKARDAQLRFDDRCAVIGRRALEFCAEKNVLPVVVLGRTYTIYNKALNSNVPAILREQGAIAIPVDCYPVAADVPIFNAVFWGYGQRILRAAHQIRRTPGIYSLYCSNYSCGPDSFALHFYSFIMEGKPFAIIETDGHSGDAGTKTRVEAFLHCVEQDRAASDTHKCNELQSVTCDGVGSAQLHDTSIRVLIPSMGFASDILTACMRGCGIQAETLPLPDRETLRLGRRHTSGKECLPACVTLGSLLQRLERSADPAEKFIFLMPKSNGPCRLGVYHMLDRIVLDRLGLRDRVRVWSPADSDYFADLPSGYPVLLLVGLHAADFLAQAHCDISPREKTRTVARETYDRRMAELLALVEAAVRKKQTLIQALGQVATGRLFGMKELLAAAAREFAVLRNGDHFPTVLLTGEIFVRCDAFSNDFVADKLAARGIRVKLTPVTEWLDYVNVLNRRKNQPDFFSAALRDSIHKRVARLLRGAMAPHMRWGKHFASAGDALAAARPYLRDALEGEAALTVGASCHEWRAGHIDGVINVGPLECMPSKIAEAHFVHAARRDGLLSLTLAVNGDPLEPDALDNFIFEVKSRHQRKCPVAVSN